MGAYDFYEQERRLEARAAGRFAMRTLSELTGRVVPQGILNQLAKMVWRETNTFLEDGAVEPSLRFVESDIVPAVLRRIEMLGSKSKTAQFANEHPDETKVAVMALAERAMSLQKISRGCFFDIGFAVATIRYELDRELYGLVVPAVKAVMAKVSNVDEETVLVVLREEISRVLRERIEARMWTLANLDDGQHRVAQ
ncbi:hypothetical protein [Alicyclobacillus fructus]|uniref:hypothetical protein n=1 Tax=Alicyclobacillus fructus TaxID=2816082 RepID=UPI001A9030E6|nr:hypothetical protein [Alicyclobacillus fructus]